MCCVLYKEYKEDPEGSDYTGAPMVEAEAGATSEEVGLYREPRIAGTTDRPLGFFQF